MSAITAAHSTILDRVMGREYVSPATCTTANQPVESPIMLNQDRGKRLVSDGWKAPASDRHHDGLLACYVLLRT